MTTFTIRRIRLGAACQLTQGAEKGRLIEDEFTVWDPMP